MAQGSPRGSHNSAFICTPMHLFKKEEEMFSQHTELVRFFVIVGNVKVVDSDVKR